jgi:hypothetical protein
VRGNGGLPSLVTTATAPTITTTTPAIASEAAAKAATAATGACTTVRSGVGTPDFLRRVAAHDIRGDYRNEE